MEGRFPPDDPRHVDEIVAHLARLRDDQLREIEAELASWRAAAESRRQAATTPRSS